MRLLLFIKVKVIDGKLIILVIWIIKLVKLKVNIDVVKKKLFSKYFIIGIYDNIWLGYRDYGY